jgi:hypothetical protein
VIPDDLHRDARRRAWHYRLRYCRDRVTTDRLSWSDVQWRLPHADQMVHVDAWIPATGWTWMLTRLPPAAD